MPATVPHPAPSRHRRAARVLAGVLAVGTAALMSGCGLRWETPDPSEPSPDAAESSRRTAVDDSLALAAAARDATTGAEEPVAGVLALVEDTAGTQVDALGGVYDSGLPGATPSPTATAAPATPADVLALLGETASTARLDARGASDPGLARLLAGVAASRAQLTDRLAAALGADAPAVDAEPEPDGTGDGTATEAPESPEAGLTPGSTETSAPDAAGTDLGRSEVLALVLAEDQAGFSFEVAAARLSDDARETARRSATAHRAAATAWATAAGVAGTADDPRRVSYAIAADLGSPEAVRTFCAGLLTDLAAVYADAVLGTTAGTVDRTATVDGLRGAAVDALRWGATPTALPGLPDTATAAATTQATDEDAAEPTDAGATEG